MGEDQVMELLKQLGVGNRNPKDDFFAEANADLGVAKTFSVLEIDKEALLHTPFLVFDCEVQGCGQACESVVEYEQHYSSCHRHMCSQCSKNLHTAHLLDLHLLETHDAYFAVLAEQKPMYCCFLEECKDVFKTAQERKAHAVDKHSFPADFRYDDVRKHKSKGRVKPQASQPAEPVEGCSGDMKMDLDETADSGKKKKKKKEKKRKEVEVKGGAHKGFEFHMRGRGRRVFSDFTKDLRDSLPGPGE